MIAVSLPQQRAASLLTSQECWRQTRLPECMPTTQKAQSSQCFKDTKWHNDFIYVTTLHSTLLGLFKVTKGRTCPCVTMLSTQGIAISSNGKVFISTVSTVSESHDTQTVKYNKSHRLKINRKLNNESTINAILSLLRLYSGMEAASGESGVYKSWYSYQTRTKKLIFGFGILFTMRELI